MELMLTDKDVFPTDEVIFSHIGRAKAAWQGFFGQLETDHPEFTSEWRFYKDGGRWLMKMQQKKKTVFWLAIMEKAFVVTFYFVDRAEKAINDSTISAALKKQFKEAQHCGKIRPLQMVVKTKKDIEDIFKVIEVKLSVK